MSIVSSLSAGRYQSLISLETAMGNPQLGLTTITTERQNQLRF